jgi:hypothetical protein
VHSDFSYDREDSKKHKDFQKQLENAQAQLKQKLNGILVEPAQQMYSWLYGKLNNMRKG